MTFHYQNIKQEIQDNRFTKTSALFSKDSLFKMKTLSCCEMSVLMWRRVNLKVNDFIHPLKMTLGHTGVGQKNW